MKYKKQLLFVILLGSFCLIPTLASASVVGWAEQKAESIVTFLLYDIFQPVFDFMIKALLDMRKTSTMSEVPYVETGMTYMRIIAATFLTPFLGFQLWKGLSKQVFTSEIPPVAYTLYKAVVAAAFIYGLPKVLLLMLKINEYFIDMIGTLGVSFDSGFKAILFPPATNTLLVLTVAIFTICLVGLTVSNSVRYAELCFLYVIGPLLAIDFIGKGELLKNWIFQAIATTFTQCIQYFLVGLSLNFTMNMGTGNWYSWFAPIGTIIVAIRGPQVLRQLLYSSGVAGAGSGIATQLVANALRPKGK